MRKGGAETNRAAALETREEVGELGLKRGRGHMFATAQIILNMIPGLLVTERGSMCWQGKRKYVLAGKEEACAGRERGKQHALAGNEGTCKHGAQ